METEGHRLAELSLAIRASTLQRFRRVRAGRESWRPAPGAMSVSDLAAHLIEADRWLLEKLAAPSLASIEGQASEAEIGRDDYLRLLELLAGSGDRRAQVLGGLGDKRLEERVPDERFGGEVSVWWVIVRGNLEHEIHHRGQVAGYLRAMG